MFASSLSPDPRRNRERGGATLETVGIVAIATLLVAAVVGAVVQTSPAVQARVERAICEILTLGQGACETDPAAVDDPPYYEPTECLVGSHYGQAGGSVKIVIVEVGADGDYELARVRYMADDGSYEDKWVLTTMRGGHLGVDLTLGAGASGSWGDGGGSAKVDVGLRANVEGMGGTSYEFDTEEDARRAVDAWKSQNDWQFWDTDAIGADAHTELWTAGLNVEAYGSAGPLGGSGTGAKVVGYAENQHNGDRTLTMVTSMEVAGELGIPVPDQLVALAAEGKAGGEIGLNVTFDRDGNLVEIEGTMAGIVHGSVGVGVDEDGVVGASGGMLEDLALPELSASGGRLAQLTFSTTFRDPDGSLDYSAAGVLGSSLATWLTTQQPPSDYEAELLRRQLNERSRVTFDTYHYQEDDKTYGGEVKIKVVALGGEVHVRTVDQQIASGHYYDPVQGTWLARQDCGI